MTSDEGDWEMQSLWQVARELPKIWQEKKGERSVLND